VSSKLVTRRA